MKINLILLAFLFATLDLISSNLLQFQIIKTYSGDHHHQNDVKIGTLTVTKNMEYNQVSANIIPNYSVLISDNEVNQKTVVLQFVPVRVSDLKHENKIYKTSVSEIMAEVHDQIIGVVFDLQLNIKAINFVQRRSPMQQIRTEIIRMQQGKQQILKIQPAAKQGEASPQNQSFWVKYKWPLIIVGVLLFLSNSMSQEKEGEGQAAQGGAPRR